MLAGMMVSYLGGRGFRRILAEKCPLYLQAKVYLGLNWAEVPNLPRMIRVICAFLGTIW